MIRKNPNPETPFNINFKDISQVINWKPLYDFLKHVFEDKYLDVADGFMFMGAVKYWEGILIYEYKHGITRRVVTLLEDGTPVKVEVDYRREIINGKTIFNDYVLAIHDASYKDTIKNVYENIDKFYGVDNGVFTKYAEYMLRRDEKLNELGYNVVTVSDRTEFSKLNDLKHKAI
jgi:hypothetical protein